MKRKILVGVIMVNVMVVLAIAQYPPIPLLAQYPPIPLRLQAVTDPNIVIADINKDGKVTAPDWFLYTNAYQNARGQLPVVKLGEVSLLKMELGLRDQEIAILNRVIVELQDQVHRDDMVIKQFLQQLSLVVIDKLTSKMQEMIDMNQTEEANIYKGSVEFIYRQAGAEITINFDPNDGR